MEKVIPETGEVVEVWSPKLDDNGHEVPDPRPLQVPAGFKRPPTLAEQVQRLVRGALSRQAAEQGFETFEESEDFDVGDEIDPSTPYEAVFDPILGRDITPAEFRQNEAVYRRRYLDGQRAYFAEKDRLEALERGVGAPAPAQTKAAPEPPPEGA